jgi:MFS transporter, Spinster family, sphingosine-1-phosphate transporter
MPRNRSYLLLSFFTLLNIMGFADRSLITGFSISIINDLHINYSQFSTLSGVVFVAANAFAMLLMGYLADRFHRPRLIGFCLMLWSGMTALCGFASNFLQMAIARGLTGMGESGLAPSALGILSDVFPSHKRGMALGVFYIGVPVGVALSYFVAAYLGPVLGWRNCFLLLGCVGICLSLILFFIKDPRKPNIIQDHNRSNAIVETLNLLKTIPSLRYLLLGAIFINFSIGSTVLDLVWFVKERNFTQLQAQQLAGAFFLVGGIMGTWLGGLGSDWFAKRYPFGGRSLFLWITYSFLGIVSVVCRIIPETNPLFLPCCFIGCINIMIIASSPLAAAIEFVPEQNRSTMIAIGLILCNVLGYSFGSFVVGYLSDYFAKIGYQNPISWADFWVTLIGLPGVICFYLSYRFHKKSEV